MATASVDFRDLVREKGFNSLGVSAQIEAQATAVIAEQIEHARRSKKVFVRQKLSAEDGEKLQKRYGGAYDLQLTQEFTAPHSFAGAMRQCETLECLNFFPEGELILDFGGSWLFHWSRNLNVHSCCPVLDARDMARHQERFVHMQKLINSNHAKYLNHPEPDFCMNVAEKCQVKASYAISIHGAYDMGLTNLCKAMHEHGTLLLRGTMMFDANMLMFDQGIIKDLNCKWTKRKRTLLDKEEVVFDFIDESTLSYVHSWENVKSFITDQAVRVGNTLYLLERCTIEFGIMSFKITAVSGDIPETKLRHCVWFPNVKGYVYVNVVDVFRPLKWRKVKVKLDTVRETEEICFRCFKENKSWDENLKLVASVLSSKSSTIIVNGMAMMAGERLGIDDYDAVAFTLLLSAKRKFERYQAVYKKIVWNGWWNHFKLTVLPGSSFREFMSNFMPSLSRYYDTQIFIETITECCEFEDEIDMLRGAPRDLLDEAKEVKHNALTLAVAIALSKKKDEPKTPVVVNDASPGHRVDEVVPPPPSQGKLCVRKQAMIEFREYQLRLHSNTEANLRRYWLLCGGTKKNSHLISMTPLETLRRTDGLANYRKANGTWKYPTEQEYAVGYNHKGLGPMVDGESYLVNKDCVLVNGELLAAAVPQSAPSGDICVVDGVAGCGKTTSIKNCFKADTDVIVTANKKSAVDVRRALWPDGVDSEIARTYVRTADSVLINGTKGLTPLRVLFDEVGLIHFGQLCAVFEMYKSRSLLGFGDSEQISFCSRDRTFELKYHQICPDTSSLAAKTYRCPRDVVDAVKNLKMREKSKYNEWSTNSSVGRSLNMKNISSVREVPMRKDLFYLTMTQADKATIISHMKELHLMELIRNVKTVHEAQGISEKNVCLVRLSSNKCDLYSKTEYCLVGLTRHTQAMTYYHNGLLGGDKIHSSILSVLSKLY